MNIQVDEHARERAFERGATEEEIVDTLQTGTSIIAKENRLAKEKVYSFEREWRGKIYREKKVKVIYTIEGDKMMVITVLVMFGLFT